MIFSQAIPLRDRPKYSEGSALAPSRDQRNNSFLWKKARTESEQQVDYGTAINKLSRELAKQRRRIVGGFVPTPQVPTMYPFKIYNPPNISNNFILQVRGGLVGFRSAYTAPNIEGLQFYQGNNEFPLIACGTDDFPAVHPTAYPVGIEIEDYSAQPTLNQGGVVNVADNAGAVLICENKPNTTMPTGIYVNIKPAKDAQYPICVAFFGRIVDDPAVGPYTQLWSKCVSSNISGSGFTASYPPFTRGQEFNDDVTFAIGIIYYQTASSTPVISQAQVGHLVNRYLELMPWATNSDNFSFKFAGQVQMDRGGWNNNSLSGKVFYPGDLVYDDSSGTPFAILTAAPSGGNIQFYVSYVYTPPLGFPSTETVPPSASANFKPYGMKIISPPA